MNSWFFLWAEQMKSFKISAILYLKCIFITKNDILQNKNQLFNVKQLQISEDLDFFFSYILYCLCSSRWFLQPSVSCRLTKSDVTHTEWELKCVRTSDEPEERTQAAAVMKSPISMVKPGRPRKKNRGEQERMMVFRTSWWWARTRKHHHLLHVCGLYLGVTTEPERVRLQTGGARVVFAWVEWSSTRNML